MWRTLATIIILAPPPFTDCQTINDSIFREEQVIFTSSNNISKLLVQGNDKDKSRTDPVHPTVFFTILDARFNGGSCIYVLEELAAYEILEGGRDSTMEYGSDRNVFFGGKDGVFKFNRGQLSAKKFGTHSDSIIQLQKASGIDKIYYLTESNKMYQLEKQGTVKTKLRTIICAAQFVLDTSNNLYYVQCKTDLLFIIRATGNAQPMLVDEEFSQVMLVRPAFLMDESIPVLGDGTFYILFVNGTCEMKDFHIPENISAISIDTTLYITIAMNGKIYEYNVMEVILNSMYGVGAPWPPDVSKIIISILSSTKDVFGSYTGVIP